MWDVSERWEVRPRRQSWGVYSVRAHLNLAALAAEVLYYDRLVLPSAETEKQADRFDSEGWDTQLLNEIVGHLDELAHVIPWDEEMRAAWRLHRNWLRDVHRNTEDAAYGATPLTLIPHVWNDARQHQVTGELPPVAPRITAAYLEPGEALADYAFTTNRSGSRDGHAAAIIRRKVRIMDGEDAYDCFLRAVRLAREPDYQEARARLLAFEEGMIVDEVSGTDAAAAFEKAHASFNSAIASYDSRTKWHYVSRLVAIGSGKGASALTGVPIGGIASYGVQKGLALFPAFNRGSDPRDEHPGRALEMISAAFPDNKTSDQEG